MPIMKDKGEIIQQRKPKIRMLNAIFSNLDIHYTQKYWKDSILVARELLKQGRLQGFTCHE
jgi:hypothetical protein